MRSEIHVNEPISIAKVSHIQISYLLQKIYYIAVLWSRSRSEPHSLDPIETEQEPFIELPGAGAALFEPTGDGAA